MYRILPDGRRINAEGALGRRLLSAHTTRVLTCTYCHTQHGNARGPWRNEHA